MAVISLPRPSRRNTLSSDVHFRDSALRSSHLNRRRFLQGSLAAAAGLALPRDLDAAPARDRPASPAEGPEPFLTDVNAYLGPWPFRRVSGDESGSLIALLRRCGVGSAWVASLDGLLHKDVAAVNARLAETCSREGRGLLVPFGTVNPALPDWEEDLRRCHEVHRMPGIRLHPNYHGYALDDPRLVRLAEIAGRRGLVVQIATELEDARTQHALLQVPPVDLSPLAEVTRRFPQLRVVVLHLSLGVQATRLAGSGRVYFDTSRQEGLQGLSRALESLPVDRLLFGSQTPLFIYEANLLKLRESPLSEEQLHAIATRNAHNLLRSTS